MSPSDLNLVKYTATATATATALPDPNEDNGPSVTACAILCAVISSIFVALRFYTRASLVRLVGWEDWLILLALLCGIGTCACIGVVVSAGLGKHTIYMEHNMQTYMKWTYFATTFYNFSLGFTKLSILCLYLRILTFEYAQRMTKILFGIVLVSQLFIICAYFTSRIPLDSFWDLSKPVVYTHPGSVYLAASGLHMSTDILIFLLPVPVVVSMTIPRRQRIALCGVFMLGLFVVLISAYRLYKILQSVSFPDPDMSFNAASIANLTCIEPCAAVACACLTTLRPLAAKLWSRIFGPSDPANDDPTGAAAAGPGSYQRPPTIGSEPSHVAWRNRDRDRSRNWRADSFASERVPNCDCKEAAAGSSTAPSTCCCSSFTDRSSRSMALLDGEDGEGDHPACRGRGSPFEVAEISGRAPWAIAPFDEYHLIQEELAGVGRTYSRPRAAGHGGGAQETPAPV